MLPSMNKILAYERLIEILAYDNWSGIFRWKILPSRKIKIDTIAGGKTSHGYIAISIDENRYYAHHLAWLYEYKIWPILEIDHIDTIRDHNWIDNLRQATTSNNSANTRKYSNNKSGHKGVSWAKERNQWVVFIRRGNIHKNLGYFAPHELEKAAKAYEDAANKYFGEFARIE